MDKPDVTRDVTEIVAWRKAVRLIYDYEPNPRVSLVKLLVSELNIQESTARMFMADYNKFKDKIVLMIQRNPFKNEIPD